MNKLKFVALTLFGILLFSASAVAVINQNQPVNNLSVSDDFYFVHLTDTHIRHKIFDPNEVTTNILKTVVETVISYENKPAFIVITGDLTEWAAGITGAFNAIAFSNCFYEQDNQLYADKDFTIPVYTTPGNHDYVLHRNLRNYHRYIDKKHVADEDRYIVTHEDVSLFFMDSGPNYYSDISILFEWHGEGLCGCDIEWLEEGLINCESSKKIILMHHPAVGEEADLFINYREEFVDLCETYEVDIVLAGHTHKSRVYDYDLVLYEDYPINSSLYSTLYVQSDDCKGSIHYRNISLQKEDIWIEDNTELFVPVITSDFEENTFKYIFIDIQKNIFNLQE